MGQLEQHWRGAQNGEGAVAPEDFFASLTAEEVIALRDRGVSGAYVEQKRAAGMHGLSIKDLIKLYDNGVTPRFVLDLQEAGLLGLTRDQLIEPLSHAERRLRARDVRARPHWGDAWSAGEGVRPRGGHRLRARDARPRLHRPDGESVGGLRDNDAEADDTDTDYREVRE